MTICLGVFWGWVSMLVIEIHHHRGVSHESYEPSKFLQTIFKMYNWWCLGLSEEKWKELHLRHHEHADKELDPHSPRNWNKWKLLLFFGLYYLRETNKEEALESKTRQLLLIPFRYGLPSLILLSGMFGFKVAFLAWITHKAYYILTLNWLNAFGHRQIKGRWRAINRTSCLAVWASWGESLHAAHHRKPTSARLGKYDPCFWVIKLFKQVKLVKAIKV